MKLQVSYFTRGFVLMCMLFFAFAMHGAPVFPGQNVWGIAQDTAQTVEVMSEAVSVFDTVFNSKMDVLSSFVDQGCDLTTMADQLADIESMLDKIDHAVEQLNPSVLDITISLIEEIADVAQEIVQTVSIIEMYSVNAFADVSVLDVALQEHNASITAQLMGISAQVSVVDSKVDKLSSSVFPVLATLATANAVSVVDSKVDKLSNSLFPVLATLATTASITPLATVVAVSVVDSKVDKLSSSLFPVLATLATSASITQLATGAAVSVVDSAVDQLSNSVFPVLATILADVSFPTPITTSMTITTSGCYQLAKNIVGNITINADAVTLDLNGFTITSPGAIGVTIATGHKYIMVKNGFITGGTNGINVATNNSDFVISDIEVSDTTGIGMTLVATNNTTNTIKNFTIKNCAVRNISNTGYNLNNCIQGELNNCTSQETARGFNMVGSINIIVNDCLAIRPAAEGFLTATTVSSCVFNRCKALNAATTGINLSSPNSSVTRCIAMNCGTNGFTLAGAAAIASNIYTNNLAINNTLLNYSVSIANAPLTSAADATMNFWKNYQA